MTIAAIQLHAITAPPLLFCTGTGDLVPADLLAAARNALSECEQRRQQLKQVLSQRSERWALVRSTFVERVRSKRLLSAAGMALATWQLSTLTHKVQALAGTAAG